MEQKQNKSTTSNCKVIRIVLQCNAGINIITCFEVSGGYCTALLSTHPCRLQVCRRGVWGGSRTSLSAKFEDNSKPSSRASHIRQKLVVQVVCTPGVCTHKGFDCSYSNGHNCCQQRIIFTVPTLCCLLPAFHQERREATASLLIIHTRTRYQPLCGEQIEITRDTFCNAFYFNTWGLGTTMKHSR